MAAKKSAARRGASVRGSGAGARRGAARHAPRVKPAVHADVEHPGEVSRMGKAQLAALRRRWKRSASLVDERDVEYVIDRGLDKAEELVASSNPFLVRLGRRALLLHQLLGDWWNEEAEAKWGTISGATAALLYFSNPLDLIPDSLPVIGWADDAAVLDFALEAGRPDLRRYARLRGLDVAAHGL